MTNKVKKPTMKEQIRQWKSLTEDYKGKLESLESTVKLLFKSGEVSEKAFMKIAREQGMTFLYIYGLLDKYSGVQAEKIWNSKN